MVSFCESTSRRCAQTLQAPMTDNVPRMTMKAGARGETARRGRMIKGFRFEDYGP